jgi:hypothetical protein
MGDGVGPGTVDVALGGADVLGEYLGYEKKKQLEKKRQCGGGTRTLFPPSRPRIPIPPLPLLSPLLSHLTLTSHRIVSKRQGMPSQW